MAAQPILAIPPFPGARPPSFATPVRERPVVEEPDVLLAALSRNRVGGCYWGRQRHLSECDVILDGTANPKPGATVWTPDDDPWALMDSAVEARLPANDGRALLALAAGLPLTLVDRSGSEVVVGAEVAENLLSMHLTGWRWTNPFDGTTLTPLEAIEMCGFWRRLIDSNRRIHSVLGIAYWKKSTLTPLLWGGAPVPYGRSMAEVPKGRSVAIWRTRISAAQDRELAAKSPAVMEIEDGFIRSVGLGADCVPPLSIVVDALGAHFDPTGPSDLERLLEEGQFSPELLARCRALREVIVEGGISKYEGGCGKSLDRPGGEKRHVLVPGQVEDDRAVTSGGALASNLELLRRARDEAGPDAFLIYKPHPDVLAGHRCGMIPEREVAALADRVETGSPMVALIDMVDELHVNSSLAGFEALMRGKQVTVHGVPFYAGWGLTTDRGPVPTRRTARRTLDELAAAALLLYPRYLDPLTGLPCPAEVLVERLAGSAPQFGLMQSALIGVRRSHGRARARLARLFR